MYYISIEYEYIVYIYDVLYYISIDILPTNMGL